MTREPNTIRLTQRKRAAILTAAIELFSEQGFEVVTMDAIADRAEVSKRTVYKHFSSKDLLFRAIVDELKAGCRLTSPLIYDSSRPIELQLTEFLILVIDLYCLPRSRKLARVILARLVRVPKLGRELLGDKRVFESDLVAWLKLAMRDDHLRLPDPAFAAKHLLGMVESFTVWPQLVRNASNPTKSERRQLARECVRTFLARYSI